MGIRSGAVSYTHLDKLKLDYSQVSDALDMGGAAPVSREDVDALTNKSVSYTHLDVYKRQGRFAGSRFERRYGQAGFGQCENP